MTRDKDLKRLVRSRMRKTGESYTAARAQVAKKRVVRRTISATDVVGAAAPAAGSASLPVPAPGGPARAPSPDEYAAIAGMSDAAVKAKTGCTWEKWVRSLDHHGADELSHREIAKMVRERWKVGPWWAQTVAVGYERIKGLRDRGQQRDGTHQMSKSRTFAVPVNELFAAWSDARVRRRWLDGEQSTVRSSTPPKYMRLVLGDGVSVAVVFTQKGGSKSIVAVEQVKLPDRATAERLRDDWRKRLDALGKVLAKT